MIKFLSSRINRYIMIATVTIIISLSGVIWYQFNKIGDLNQSVGNLESQMSQAVSEIENQNNTINDIQEQQKASEQAYRQRQSDASDLSEQRELNKENIREIEKNDPQISDYLNDRIPDSVLNNLRETDKP